MAISQEAIPDHFRNLWRVAGSIDEYEHASKLCRVLGWEKDGEGQDVVRVQFVDRKGLFDAEEAVMSNHMLLPA